MTTFLRLLLLTLLLAAPVRAVDYYASTSGSGTTCSEASPCAIAAAITKPSPGDTVYFRAGNYTTAVGFNFSTDGSVGSRITYKNYPGEVPVIVSSLDNDPEGDNDTSRMTGDYVTIQGFRITNSATDRVTCNRPSGVLMSGVGTRLINNIIDNNGNGVMISSIAVGAIANGNILVNNGWEADGELTTVGCVLGTGLTGHGIYPQSSGVANPVILQDNVILFQWGYGVHFFSTHSDKLRGLTFDGNFVGDSGAQGSPDPNFFCGGNAGEPVDELLFTDNYIYDGAVAFGYADEDQILNLDAVVNDNIFAMVQGDVHFRGWTTVQFRDNLLWSDSTNATVNLNLSNVGRAFDWDDNDYFNAVTTAFLIDGDDWFTFANWKIETGFDAASTSTVGNPSTVTSDVSVNAYDSNRALVRIFSPGSSSAVSVNVSSLLANGDSYELINTQNPLAAPITGTLSGTNLTITINGLSVAAPLGGGSTPSSTGPTMTAFVLVKTASGGAPPVLRKLMTVIG